LVTKTITITKSAYEALIREKRERESFSNLALRLTSKHGTLKECLGLWKLSRKERKIFKDIKKSWEDSDDELKRRLGS
jgi:predicted CopG family antitoxin